MATMAVPDSSGPRLDLLADSSLNATPQFPFVYAPSNGYIAVSPAVTYTPATAEVELVFTNVPSTVGDEHTCKEVILAVCEDRKVMLTNRRIAVRPNGWNVGSGNDYATFDTFTEFNEQETYVYRISIPDKDNITVTIFNKAGDQLDTTTLSLTDIWDGNPVFHVGFPTDAQVANGVPGDVKTLLPGTGVKLIEMRAGATPATGVVLSPNRVRVGAEAGYWVGRLAAVTASPERGPFTYAFDGGNNDADFVLRGANLHTSRAFIGDDAGIMSVDLMAIDRFGVVGTASALSILVGSMNAPTDIVATGGEHPAAAGINVVEIAVTDADAGDIHTLELVAGTGDTDNSKFVLAGTFLSIAPAEFPVGAGTFNIRVKATDLAGLSYTKAVTFTIVDTTAPEMSGFTVPDGTSYTVTPTGVSSDDAVGTTHYKITETNVAPAHDAAGWVAAVDFLSTAYTIVTQNGSGSYTLYCWAKDAANNVSSQASTSQFNLTIA